MISMQTFVCEPCGRGWPIEMQQAGSGDLLVPRITKCTNCGRKLEPRGIAWVRVPLQGGNYAGKSRTAGR